MSSYFAFLRGVNVGGVLLKMEDLQKLLEYIGFTKVRTYIQSGNAIFESGQGNKRKMEAEIAYEVKAVVGRDIGVLVFSMEELAAIVASHPLEALGPAEKLYVTLLAQEPEEGDRENLLGTMNDIDRHAMGKKVVYSYYGEGYGNSKRSNNFIEKMLKVTATTRNWTTMRTVYEMGRASPP
ncbi:MAG TPA: DUF1697 domain-containing protein [Rectinemataceae bacterium]|nr:DUF1697 domain-containing protein [Rectinemataceae bacterium]